VFRARLGRENAELRRVNWTQEAAAIFWWGKPDVSVACLSGRYVRKQKENRKRRKKRKGKEDKKGGESDAERHQNEMEKTRSFYKKKATTHIPTLT